MEEKSWKNLRYSFLATVSTLALTVSVGAFNHNACISLNNDFYNFNPYANTVDNSVKTIAFQTDTFDTYKSALLLNTGHIIYRYFPIGSSDHQMQLPLFAHEERHGHNAKIKYWEKAPYSPSEFIQLRMHEEISANVAAILTAELEYCVAENKGDIIKKYENTYMGFYFMAIKKHEINPQSQKQKDLDKKYSLLVNGAIKMWEKKYARHYTPALFSLLTYYLSCCGFHKSHPHNYKKVLSHMYNFGGVDLSKYIKTDAHYVSISLNIFDELHYSKDLRKNKSLRRIIIDDVERELPNILINFTSLEKRSIALQHLFLAASMKYEIQELQKKNTEISPAIISTIYNKQLYKLTRSNNFNTIVKRCAKYLNPPYIFQQTTEDKYLFDNLNSSLFSDKERKFIEHLYNLKGNNFCSYINNFDIYNFSQNKYLFFAKPFNDYFPYKQDLFNNESIFSNSSAPNYNFSMIKSEQKSKNNTNFVQRAVKPRRSDTMFITIPDFEQAIFQPNALTAKGWQQLSQLYKDFDAIPEVLKSCRLNEIVKYLEKNNNPQYFVSKTDPLHPIYKTQKATLQKNKPLNQYKKNKGNLARRQFHKQR